MASAPVFKVSPKLAKLVSQSMQPTVAVGQPMPPMQTIPEPVDLVGRYTGIKHAALGDNPNGPEMVHVTPSRSGPAMGDAPGETPYAVGGTFMVGPSLTGNDNSGGGYYPSQPDPNSYEPTAPVMSGQSLSPWEQWSGARPSTGAGAGGGGGGGSSPNLSPWQQWTGAQPNGSPVYSHYPGDPISALWSARQQQLNAQRGSIYAQQGALGAQNNVLNATAATFPYQNAYRQSQQNVNALEQAQNQQQAGVLRQQQGNEQARLNELTSIYNASRNVPDILAGGETQNAYNAEDRRDQSLGVSAPATVVLPPGAASTQPGVRGAIQTQEQALTRAAGYADPIRASQLSLAQTALSITGNSTQAAQLLSQRLGIDLNAAQQAVEEARNQAGYAQEAAQGAGLQSNLAGLDVNAAQQPPAPGLVAYTDPETGQGEWLTPAQAELNRAEFMYGPNGVYSQRLTQGLTTSQVRRNVSGLSVGQVTTGVRDGTIDDNTARSYLLAAGYSEDDANRILAEAHSGRGATTAGGYTRIQ